MREPEWTARDRIEAHRVAREADEIADNAPWAAWLLRPLAWLIRKLDTDIENARGEDDVY